MYMYMCMYMWLQKNMYTDALNVHVGGVATAECVHVSSHYPGRYLLNNYQSHVRLYVEAWKLFALNNGKHR